MSTTREDRFLQSTTFPSLLIHLQDFYWASCIITRIVSIDAVVLILSVVHTLLYATRAQLLALSLHDFWYCDLIGRSCLFVVTQNVHLQRDLKVGWVAPLAIKIVVKVHTTGSKQDFHVMMCVNFVMLLGGYILVPVTYCMWNIGVGICYILLCRCDFSWLLAVLLHYFWSCLAKTRSNKIPACTFTALRYSVNII